MSRRRRLRVALGSRPFSSASEALYKNSFFYAGYRDSGKGMELTKRERADGRKSKSRFEKEPSGKIYLFGIETGGNFLDKTAFVLPGNSDYLDSPSSAR